MNKALLDNLAALGFLVCPVTRKRLVFNDSKNELISQKAHLAYPVKGNVGIMLPSEGRVLEEEIFLQ